MNTLSKASASNNTLPTSPIHHNYYKGPDLMLSGELTSSTTHDYGTAYTYVDIGNAFASPTSQIVIAGQQIISNNTKSNSISMTFDGEMDLMDKKFVPFTIYRPVYKNDAENFDRVSKVHSVVDVTYEKVYVTCDTGLVTNSPYSFDIDLYRVGSEILVLEPFYAYKNGEFVCYPDSSGQSHLVKELGLVLFESSKMENRHVRKKLIILYTTVVSIGDKPFWSINVIRYV